jgi:hypothetical protein
MCRIDCDVDPDGTNIEILKAVVQVLEDRAPDPLTWEGNHLFSSLVNRLDAVAGLNDNLKRLEQQAIGVFVGSYFDRVQRPEVSPYDPPHTRDGTIPSQVTLTRVLLSGADQEKIVVQKEVRWPVRIWKDPDLDDNLPF